MSRFPDDSKNVQALFASFLNYPEIFHLLLQSTNNYQLAMDSRMNHREYERRYHHSASSLQLFLHQAYIYNHGDIFLYKYRWRKNKTLLSLTILQWIRQKTNQRKRLQSQSEENVSLLQPSVIPPTKLTLRNLLAVLPQHLINIFKSQKSWFKKFLKSNP